MLRRHALSTLLFVAVLHASAGGAVQAKPIPALDLFFKAAAADGRSAAVALEQIGSGWKDGYAGMMIDLADLMRRSALSNPLSMIRYARLIEFLETMTGQHFGDDLSRWRDWVWSLPYDPHPGYAAFKGALYAPIDPRFEEFFREPTRSSIRLDQVEWGGVGVNGIPPLDHPKHVAAAEAAYLQDDNVVFGVSSAGVSRAYPKRILAWHELALDRVGDLDVTLVYCTLCGTVIPCNSRVGGVTRTFGTSGLLYRSNKLMFDAETKSLWSSLEGTPVIGPLVGAGLHLAVLPVVTTTWREWRQDHPDTTVLSMETGFKRDYSEGAAYRGYFSTDRLMFQVPATDNRLKNKDEVLVLRGSESDPTSTPPVAIAAGFLLDHRVHSMDFDGRHLVVVTTPAGANRVYESGSYNFKPGLERNLLVDVAGATWVVEESELRTVSPPLRRLPRVPAHRAFWFGWYAQHPDTLLIK